VKSAWAQKQTFAVQNGMSAFIPNNGSSRAMGVGGTTPMVVCRLAVAATFASEFKEKGRIVALSCNSSKTGTYQLVTAMFASYLLSVF
jgi:hypothetical protein